MPSMTCIDTDAEVSANETQSRQCESVKSSIESKALQFLTIPYHNENAQHTVQLTPEKTVSCTYLCTREWTTWVQLSSSKADLLEQACGKACYIHSIYQVACIALFK